MSILNVSNEKPKLDFKKVVTRQPRGLGSTITYWLLALMSLILVATAIFSVLDGKLSWIGANAGQTSAQWLPTGLSLLFIVLLAATRSRPGLTFVFGLFSPIYGVVTSGLAELVNGDSTLPVVGETEGDSILYGIFPTVSAILAAVAMFIGLAWIVSAGVAHALSNNGFAGLHQSISGAVKTGSVIGELGMRKRTFAERALLLFALAYAAMLAVNAATVTDVYDSTVAILPSLWAVVLAGFVVAGLFTRKALVIVWLLVIAWQFDLGKVLGYLLKLGVAPLTTIPEVGTISTVSFVGVLIFGIWVWASSLIMGYKSRIMKWAEARSDAYGDLDTVLATSQVAQRVSTLSVFALIFAFLMPVVGLALAYAARNDVITSRGQKNGFDMAITASIIAWSLLVSYLLAAVGLVVLTLTGSNLLFSLLGIYN